MKSDYPELDEFKDDEVIVIEEPSNGWKNTFARLGAGAFFISVLVHVCFIALAIFAFYTLVTPPVDAPPDFRGSGGGGGGDGGHRIQQQARAQQKMASSMSRTIVSTAISDVALPDSTPTPTTSSLPDLAAGAGAGGGTGGGTGTGNGTGIGSGSGPGVGSGKGIGQGGNITFFNQTTRGKRVAYVIDYSLSMSGKRIKLLRAELKRSVAGLGLEKEYQIFFFAGPAWLAGDKVDMDSDRKSATVHAGNRTYDWAVPKDRPVWEMKKGRSRSVSWMKADPARIADSLTAIEETPLIYGTSWEGPLEMALALNPAPDLIFFMTDGVSGRESMNIAEKMGQRAKTKKTIINSIAMMEPDAVEPMKELARRSGGKFSVINEDGTVEEKPLEPGTE